MSDFGVERFAEGGEALNVGEDDADFFAGAAEGEALGVEAVDDGRRHHALEDFVLALQALRFGEVVEHNGEALGGLAAVLERGDVEGPIEQAALGAAWRAARGRRRRAGRPCTRREHGGEALVQVRDGRQQRLADEASGGAAQDVGGGAVAQGDQVFDVGGDDAGGHRRRRRCRAGS